MPTGISNGSHNVSRSQREFLAYWKEAGAKEEREKRLRALQVEQYRAYQELLKLDPEGGEAWFDDDANVPAFGSIRERIEILKTRIRELREVRSE